MPKHGISTFERPGAFGMYVRRLHDVVTQQLESSLVDAGCKLKGTATTIVWLLKHQGPQSLTNIAKQLRYSHQLATQRANWLEQRGFVRITIDPEDKRRRTIMLTDDGLQEYNRLEMHVTSLERAYTSVFNEIGMDVMKVIRDTEKALLERSLSTRIQQSEDT